MATVLKLKANPTFQAKASIPRPGEPNADLLFTFKHRTSTELKEFTAALDGMTAVEQVMGTAIGWEIEEEFSVSNVEVFLVNYHGAARAIADTYFRELTGLRSKN